jgi:CHAT domain-containing protein/tetratricopeptide (TPR) repeat protein
MQQAELAALLVDASNADREALLCENSALVDVGLGYLLKDICLDGWSTHPGQAIGAAASLQLLVASNPAPEIKALTAWTSGLRALISGELVEAIRYLEESEGQFLTINKPHIAAATQISKLIALSMLGRHDEAIQCGLRARQVFLEHNDLHAAGKIEHNIGNIYFRRDRYRDAEVFQTAAQVRFATLNDLKQLATVNNCLANTHALLHNFESAEALYQQALEQAEAAGQPVTLAGIEGNIGLFALLQGRYNRALDYLERSHQRYTSLRLTIQSILAEHEIADVYLELNLAPEALKTYESVITIFAEHGMRAEEARARAYGGRALVLLGQTQEAQSWLAEAERLYTEEGNPVGAALVALTHAQLLYREGKFDAAKTMAAQAEPALVNSGSWQRLLLARWLRGEAERSLGNIDSARVLLEQTLRETDVHQQPQVAERCLSSLGLLALRYGDSVNAESHFKKAVKLTEDMLAPIPGEEFRSAFFAERLSPYHELVKLCLAQGNERIAEAFGFVESARSRSLADSLRGRLTLTSEPRNDFEAHLVAQLQKLKEERNYLYNQLHRSVRGVAHNKESNYEVQQELLEREQELLLIQRRLQHRGVAGATNGRSDHLSLTRLQESLGVDRALVEYTSVDDTLIAFVLTNEQLSVVRDLGSSSATAALVEQFRFQVDSLRFGSDTVRNHLAVLTERIRKHACSLYDQLLRTIEPKLGSRHVVIVPHGILHYLPFQALHDGDSYLIERREVSYAPSAAVLQQCLDRQQHVFEKALLMGVSDERNPRVHEELRAVQNLVPHAQCFVDETATTQVLSSNSAGVDLVHLACHAQFRSDNPLFSSLRLDDGAFTVRDAYDLKLNCSLVTLSACETGLSGVAPGDELMGLARGFLSAGSPSVLLSLWTVEDEATAELMVSFYEELVKSKSPAAALRKAQIDLLKQTPHPFFWSPFVMVGRW